MNGETEHGRKLAIARKILHNGNFARADPNAQQAIIDHLLANGLTQLDIDRLLQEARPRVHTNPEYGHEIVEIVEHVPVEEVVIEEPLTEVVIAEPVATEIVRETVVPAPKKVTTVVKTTKTVTRPKLVTRPPETKTIIEKTVSERTIRRPGLFRDEIGNNSADQEAVRTADSSLGYIGNIRHLSLNNDNFRRVVHTTKEQQLVVMSLKPREEIGMEVHDDTDQFLRIEEGAGVVITNGVKTEFVSGDAIMIPMGMQHNVIAGPRGAKLYTIYSPPHTKG